MSNEERLISHAMPIPFSGCWLWDACVDKHGYARFGIRMPDGSMYWGKAHRAAYQFFRAPIPEGLDVCHSCDVRCCVNPSHLFVGTRKGNMQDASVKGRIRNQNSDKGVCVRGHALSGDNLLMLERGDRQCRACNNLRAAKHRATR